MRIARFFEQIRRDVRFKRPGSHPAGRPHTHMFLEHGGAFFDRAHLVLLPHAPQQFCIGTSMAEHVVAARSDLFYDLRIVIAHAAVQQDRGGQLQLIEDFEQAPIADPIAIVAPREVARRLLTAADGIHAEPSAEREVLDVERDIEGEPLAIRPTVVFAFDDRRVGVPVVGGESQHWGAPFRQLLPSNDAALAVANLPCAKRAAGPTCDIISEQRLAHARAFENICRPTSIGSSRGPTRFFWITSPILCRMPRQRAVRWHGPALRLRPFLFRSIQMPTEPRVPLAPATSPRCSRVAISNSYSKPRTLPSPVNSRLASRGIRACTCWPLRSPMPPPPDAASPRPAFGCGRWSRCSARSMSRDKPRLPPLRLRASNQERCRRDASKS